MVMSLSSSVLSGCRCFVGKAENLRRKKRDTVRLITVDVSK